MRRHTSVYSRSELKNVREFYAKKFLSLLPSDVFCEEKSVLCYYNTQQNFFSCEVVVDLSMFSNKSALLNMLSNRFYYVRARKDGLRRVEVKHRFKQSNAEIYIESI